MKRFMEHTEELFPAFQSCIARKDYGEALEYCSEIELAMEDTEGYLSAPSDRNQFYCHYMAAYLITDDLNGARFLWKRIPSEVKGKSEIAGLWNIGKCLWQQEYSLLKPLLDGPWNQETVHLARDIRTSIYNRNVKQISEAYSIVSVGTLCENLMLSTDEAIAVCQSLEWIVDEDRLFATPKALVSNTANGVDRTYDKDMEVLMNLSSYVANFEKKKVKVDLRTSITPPLVGGKKTSSYNL